MSRSQIENIKADMLDREQKLHDYYNKQLFEATKEGMDLKLEYSEKLHKLDALLLQMIYDGMRREFHISEDHLRKLGYKSIDGKVIL